MRTTAACCAAEAACYGGMRFFFTAAVRCGADGIFLASYYGAVR